MKKIFIVLLSISLFGYANEASAIMKKIDANMRGTSIYMKMKMRINSKRHSRTIQLESWSKGKKKSFVKTLYPPKDRGITFLSLGNKMWQYVPKIERTIKIPPSMMLQKWMGSDITNDDIVKQSSLIDDYRAKIIKKRGKIVTIELTPKSNSAVIWGKIISTIDTGTYTNKRDIFYDDDGKIVRIFSYKKVKKFGRYYMPTYWRIDSLTTKGNSTEIFIQRVKYDTKISNSYFRKSALKRFSR